MADVHSKEVRSFNMSRIKSKDTKPEMLVRKFLHAAGFRFRLHDKRLPGKPDLVLPKYKTVVFVHGCFWHGHNGCRFYTVPKTRTEWWLTKIRSNIIKDKRATEELRAVGWKVIEVWECSLKKATQSETLASLVEALRGAATSC